VTGLLAWARNVPHRIYLWAVYLLHTTLELHNDDVQGYRRMVRWLGTQPKIMSRNRQLHYRHSEVGTEFGFGHSWFFYKGRLVRVSRTRKEDADTGTLETRESLVLRMWGRNQSLLNQLINRANDLALKDTVKNYVDIYAGVGGDWRYQGTIWKRPLESVILKTGQLEKMVDRIRHFQDNSSKYTELGVPHRLGILLEGPPGTGKSSAILALASEFDVALKIINLSGMTDSTLSELCGDQVRGSDRLHFIVFEDADCALRGSGQTKSQGNRTPEDSRTSTSTLGVTFSGLLNAIDGLAAGQNRVVIMTTNHVERLDPALIRPGRIDMRFTLGLLDEDQATRMHERFFPGEPTDDFVTEFTGLSAATAQEGLITRYFNV